MLVEGGLYSTGLLDYAAPGSLDGLDSKAVLFGPSRYRYQEGLWDGPLVVLVDRRTASAAEGFASILRDNGAAVVMGEHTYGAGCGYTDGGIQHALPHTGLDVHLPDCVRVRADGTNEVEGVTPDVPIAWDGLDDLERASLAVRRLSWTHADSRHPPDDGT
jgi:C-terminal processing protease CtpA/Prc